MSTQKQTEGSVVAEFRGKSTESFHDTNDKIGTKRFWIQHLKLKKKKKIVAILAA